MYLDRNHFVFATVHLGAQPAPRLATSIPSAIAMSACWRWRNAKRKRTSPSCQSFKSILNKQQGGDPTYVHFGRASSEKNETASKAAEFVGTRNEVDGMAGRPIRQLVGDLGTMEAMTTCRSSITPANRLRGAASYMHYSILKDKSEGLARKEPERWHDGQ